MEGFVTDIQRFSIHDGPGIRTTVFFKGCPLHCFWCHNPETWDYKPQIQLIANSCVFCGGCVAACPKHLHTLNDIHSFDGNGCLRCGACVAACAYGALKMCGIKYTVEQIIDIVKADTAFYGDDGGITLSGGEPTSQPDFCLELLKASKQAGIKTCLQTCGMFTQDYFRQLAPYLDWVQLDIKDSDPQRLRRNTGADYDRVLVTLHLLDESGIPYEARSILLAGINDDEENIHGLAQIRNSVKNVRKWRLFGYHPLGKAKLAAIGKDVPDGNYELDKAHLKQLRELFESLTVQ